MPSLPYWLFPGDGRPAREIDDEITEELQLHLDLLAEERMRQGVAPEEAKRAAAERFGDFSTLVRRCRREKQGDIPMLKRLQAVLIAALVIAVAFIGWQQWLMGAMVSANQGKIRAALASVKQDLMAIRSSVVETPDQGVGGGFSVGYVEPPEDSVAIQVVNESNDPIPNAILSFSWATSDRNYFDYFEERTDDQGIYRTPLQYDDGKSLESVVAVAPGYAFVSTKLNRPGGFSKPLTLVLPEACSVRVAVKVAIDPGEETSEGEWASFVPADHATVRPSSRIDAQGRTHSAPSIGWQSAVTDADGVVVAGFFAKGDTARMSLSWEGALTRRGAGVTDPFRVDTSTDEVILVEETISRSYGNGGGTF